MHIYQYIKHCFLVFAIAAALLACGGGRISDSKMINIMADMYIADIVNQRHTILHSMSRDSISLYTPIFERYGVTADAFRATLDEYVNRPTELKDIYRKVTEKLDKMEKEYAQLEVTEKEEQNCWNGPDSITIDTDSLYNFADFDIELRGVGTYQIKADYEFGENDSTLNPRIVAWFTIKDNADTVIKRNSFFINKKNNAQLRVLNMDARDSAYVRLKGQLMNFDTIRPDTGKWHQQVKISNIIIEYIKEDTY